ncbi:hypothetical protein DFH08DRAFT_966153 [Mycena albidolilacea]|uniref:Uncharacterized protein n=1 Tax=Mycena albidolilacea TaxID=1033008 RepID=A0AAD6ZPN1_9AGAR|nr:hypothetical protein DFH08DRAFT_966153 [Mycena albidolilacea]
MKEKDKNTGHQILLRSLTLAGYTPSRREARALLTESPHVAGYINNFGKLTNVVRLSITADCSWDVLSAAGPSVLDFIGRQKPRELYLSLIDDLPTSVLVFSLTHASTVSFNTVTVETITNQSGQLPKACPAVTALSLFDSDGVDNLLSREDFSPYTTNLRTLSIGRSQVQPEMRSPVLPADWRISSSTCHLCSIPYHLPYLPALRSIDFRLFFFDATHEALLTAMLTSFVPFIPSTLRVISVTDYGIFPAVCAVFALAGQLLEERGGAVVFP